MIAFTFASEYLRIVQERQGVFHDQNGPDGGSLVKHECICEADLEKLHDVMNDRRSTNNLGNLNLTH